MIFAAAESISLDEMKTALEDTFETSIADNEILDAVEAVRSAIAEGIIPGGCAVQLALAETINNHPNKKQSWEIMANVKVKLGS